ncbi:hypothetical protein FHR90_002976 [Endobacter medicaginis]|uniref:TetR family transcriptional regulator n=2 Tax=Endobacter medicaginis TaxID=1181271 RepID=A0A839UZ10_9PROT|nr:TetR family transcriptional regulator [Endobacter medicaginis]MBB3175127.1 hypothetical protein [Endobacter medicaginis]MCX5476442.1 TetR family transcriptional regulator [Endobacter medicaginis]
MSETFDRALLAAAFEEIEWQGWHSFTTASAARSAGLDLGEARARFPTRLSVALRLGELADRAALAALPADPAVAPDTSLPAPLLRELLFDALMQRFDVLQGYRRGVLAMLRAARFDPALATTLAVATPLSIGWIADAIGIGGSGLTTLWRRQVLTAVWTYAARAWIRDESLDLSATMAALDHALDRAARLIPLGAPEPERPAAPPARSEPTTPEV